MLHLPTRFLLVNSNILPYAHVVFEVVKMTKMQMLTSLFILVSQLKIVNDLVLDMRC